MHKRVICIWLDAGIKMITCVEYNFKKNWAKDRTLWENETMNPPPPCLTVGLRCFCWFPPNVDLDLHVGFICPEDVAPVWFVQMTTRDLFPNWLHFCSINKGRWEMFYVVFVRYCDHVTFIIFYTKDRALLTCLHECLTWGTALYCIYYQYLKNPLKRKSYEFQTADHY